MKMKNVLLLFTLLLLIQCDVFTTNYPVYRPGSSVGVVNDEHKEFSDLIAKDQINKKQETADVLNYLLNDSEPEDPYTATVIENTSACNIIVRLVAIEGKRFYNLPVPKNTKNHFIIAKGTYTLKSNICEAKYYSQKTINDVLILTLSKK